MKRTGLLIAITLLVCAAYADPPPVTQFDPPAPSQIPPAPLQDPSAPQQDPSAPQLAAPPRLASEDVDVAPELPADLEKIRNQFKSPLEDSILGKPNENEFRAAYERLRNSQQSVPDFPPYVPPRNPEYSDFDFLPRAPENFPSPPWLEANSFPDSVIPTGVPNDLLSVTLRLDVQAYQLDRFGQYEMADELRQLNQRIREQARRSMPARVSNAAESNAAESNAAESNAAESNAAESNAPARGTNFLRPPTSY